MNSVCAVTLLTIFVSETSSFDVEGTIFSPEFERFPPSNGTLFSPEFKCFPPLNGTLHLKPFFQLVNCDTPGSRWDYKVVSQVI